MEDGAFVTVEGFLRLPNFLVAEIDPETEAIIYELSLAAERDGKGPFVKTRILGTRVNRTNHIAELAADGYTERDLRIFTASGKTVGASDRIRVSGTLSKRKKENGTACAVMSEKVETLAE
jgi:hypothetical protein